MKKFFRVKNFWELPLDFKTANNTKLNIQGAAVLDFSLKLMSVKVKVPFIVTTKYLENPTFGYNLIEHFFQGTI